MNKNSEKKWMGSLSKKEKASIFVRNILGCGCPAEVFDHFQVQNIRSGPVPFIQMIMGNRLMVRLVDKFRVDKPEKIIPEMLAEGLEERNKRGLNRFRLVIVGGTTPALKEEFMELQEKMDPKVHLHIIKEI